jgi:general secretion pathway protein A
MYESFFGLKREPFSVAPDPRFLYMSDKHREALAHLNYGLRRGAGFVLLTGEIGAGKTTVWRCFLEQLPGHFDVANVVNPKLGVNALLARICEDLQVEQPAEGGAVDLIDAIHGHLLLAFARGRRTLIVIDEAQALTPEVMEQLRLLTNLDTSGGKLQVLLIGQPELRTMLERPALEPLAQRVVARFHLPALSEVETTRYIAHRLSVAGLEGPVPFGPSALARIHRLCGGVPRRINVLCDRAMLGAHAIHSQRIDVPIVDRAAQEVFGRLPSAPAPQSRPPQPQPWPRWLALVGVGAAALAAGVAMAPLMAPARAPFAFFGGSQAHPAATATLPVAAAEPAAPPARAAAKSSGKVEMALATVAPVAVAAPGSLAVPPRANGLDAVFGTSAADEAQAWRALASLWGASLGAGEPCIAASQQALYCYRTHGGLGPIRQLGRPGIVKLADDRGRVAHVLLTGVGEDSATLYIDGAEHTVPLAALARAWRGEFATFWRAPPGYRVGELVFSNGPLAPWLNQRLAMVDGAASAPAGEEVLKARVFAFQLAHGLEPDGLAGPLTLMQINRASGVDEPRLQAARLH